MFQDFQLLKDGGQLWFNLPHTWRGGIPIGKPATLVEPPHDVRENRGALIQDLPQSGRLELVGES
jgi:hypothetical protein